jgi:hypothetical protein
LLGFIGLLAFFLLTMPNARRSHGWLARRRGRVEWPRFEKAMLGSGVTQPTAKFLWQELAAFYHWPLRPLPKDRLESRIGIDRPEIEALVTRFWSAMRGGDPLPRIEPVRIDPSVADLGRHLDLMAGWSVRGQA